MRPRNCHLFFFLKTCQSIPLAGTPKTTLERAGPCPSTPHTSDPEGHTFSPLCPCITATVMTSLWNHLCPSIFATQRTPLPPSRLSSRVILSVDTALLPPSTLALPSLCAMHRTHIFLRDHSTSLFLFFFPNTTNSQKSSSWFPLDL